jgi:putative flippase GtrA
VDHLRTCGHGGGLTMLNRVLVAQTDSLWIQLARYTLVGGVAFLVDFGCLAALTEFGHVHYLLSAAFAFVAGLTVNYFLSVAWVFRKRSIASRSCEILVFTAIGLVGLGLNEGSMWLLTSFAGVYYLASKIGSTVMVYLWNFLARRYVLFN